MRVDKREMAKRIRYELDWLGNERCKKEETIDVIFCYFARLHGIGVVVKMTGDRNNYEFMLYPDSTDTSFSKYENVYAFKYGRTAMCRSAALCLDTVHIPDATREMIEKSLIYVETELCLTHWEEYLVTDDTATYKSLYYGTVTPPGSYIDTSMFHPKFLATTISKDEVTPKTILNSLFGMKKMYPMNIEKVIFNDPATIVIWKDGSKTVVKAQDGETYDPEKGLAMAICKKAMGNTRDYYITFKKYLKQWEKENPEKKDGEILIHSNAALMAFAAIRHLNVERGVKSVDGTCNFTFSNKCDEEITVAEVPEFISQTAYDNICNIVCQRFNL